MTRIVTCILVALALTLNAEAKKEKPDKPDKSAEKVGKKKDKDNPVIIVDPIGKDNDQGGVYSVPDTGSTLLLLGTAVLVLGIAGRRFAIR
jgi:protein with PEP-CTERM/exosortase system signal